MVSIASSILANSAVGQETLRQMQATHIELFGIVLSERSSTHQTNEVEVKIYRESVNVLCEKPAQYKDIDLTGYKVVIERKAEEGFKVARIKNVFEQRNNKGIEDFIKNIGTRLSVTELQNAGFNIKTTEQTVTETTEGQTAQGPETRIIVVRGTVSTTGNSNETQTPESVHIEDSNSTLIINASSNNPTTAQQDYIENRKKRLDELREKFNSGKSDIIKDINGSEYRRNTKSYEFYSREEIEKAYRDIFKEHANDELEDIKKYLENLDKIKKCMQPTIAETKRKTRTFWDDVLDEALKLGTNFALSNLNSLLPEYLRVNVKVQRNFEDGSIVVSEFSVGQVVYNVKEETVTISGDIFNPFINSGIEEVNKLLPPFLQVSASELGLEVGEIVIRKQELQKEEQAQYRVREDIIVVNSNATTYIQMRGSRFNLGNARELFVDKSIRKGLDELNKELPDLFQVSVRRDPEDRGRIFDSGPFSIKVEGKNAGLSVDQERLKTTIELLPERLLNDVPAPLQPTAKVAWKRASIFIVEDILYAKETAARRKREKELIEQEKEKTLSLKYDSCKQQNESDSKVPAIPGTKTLSVPVPPNTQPSTTRISSPSVTSPPSG